MNKFGVCNYSMVGYEPKVENLEVFDTYEEAFARYMERLTESGNYPYCLDNTLWYVIINGDRIEQFEQLMVKIMTVKIKTKIVDIK